MTPKMKIAELLDTYPEAEDVFLDYGVSTEDIDVDMTVSQLCKAEGLDAREILAEISALAAGELDDDWDADLNGDKRGRRPVWN